MARPLRIEFPGAVYHVTARGDRQEPIFNDDIDRQALLDVVERAMTRLDAEVWAYCLMGNHYHFVLRTNQANLSRLMRQINGEYTRAFNRRHDVKGHLFQGRFHSVLVDKDAYLIKVCRYVELNPVRARLVACAVDWRWSSYRAHTATACCPPWLSTIELHGFLLGRDATTEQDHRDACRLYAETVEAGIGIALWDEGLRADIFLGNEAFVVEMQAMATAQRLRAADIPKVQRKASRSLSQWLVASRSREDSFVLAYSVGGLTMSEIASQAGLSVSSVSRMIANAERMQNSRPDTAKFKT